MEHPKIKIALVTSSLGIGGAERSAALLSVLLSDSGYDVHVISVLDHIEYNYKGKLLNLGTLKKQNDSFFGRIQRLFVLKKYLSQNKIDWIIDNRTRTQPLSEWIISRFVYNPDRSIYVVRSFNIGSYFPKNNFIARLIYKKSPHIIAVSDAVKKQIETQYGYTNVKRIYNPIASNQSSEINESPFILAYGRINNKVKNYSLLLQAYAISGLPEKNIPLYIVGDGEDVNQLSVEANDLNLADKIIFKPKMADPFPYVKAAFFTVLSSRYEGFPRTVIESLALGTPVVSVDCSGISEIITNGQNGLMVANNNPQALALAMKRFAEDTELYHICKTNAAASVAHLAMDKIAREWQQILT